MIDLVCRYCAGELSLELPSFVEQPADSFEVAVSIRKELLELLRLVAHLQKGFDLTGGILFLLAQDGAGVALMPRPEHEDLIEQSGQIAVGQTNRLHRNVSARLETEDIETAEGRRILILFADRFLEHFNLNVRGLLRQLARGYPLAAVRVESIEQPHGEAARPTESGRCRQIAHCADVDGRIDAQKAQAFARDVVFDVVDRVHLFAFRVVEPDGLIEDTAMPLYRDVDILVDGRADDCTVVGFVKGGQIGSTAGKTHPQRGASEN